MRVSMYVLGLVIIAGNLAYALTTGTWLNGFAAGLLGGVLWAEFMRAVDR